MKFENALKKLSTRWGVEIESKSLSMYSQTKDSLYYWIFEEDTPIEYKTKLLKTLFETKDWKVKK